MHTNKHQRSQGDTVAKPVSLVEDYLAYRGYPLSAWNRAVVEQKLQQCPRAADRKDVLKCLDRLFRAASATR